MNQAVFLDFFENQSRWVGDLVKPWESDEDVRRIAPILDRLIPTLINAGDLMQEAYSPICRDLFENRAEVGALVPGTRYYDAYHEVFHNVKASAKILHDAARDGHPVYHLHELDAAIDRFRRLLDEKIEDWPRIDLAAIARSRGEHERGDTLSLRELIDELRGLPEPVHEGEDSRVDPPGTGPV